MTDKELRDAAVAHLKQTTTGYLKNNGQPKAPPWPIGSTHWGPAMDLLAQIGQSVPPTPIGFDIPRWNVTLPAGAGVGTNGRIGWWRQYKTSSFPLGSLPAPHLATPASTAAGVVESWEWWYATSIVIPTSFPTFAGKHFATTNPHNSAFDVGNSGSGGIGWGFGSGVSSVHVFYNASGALELYVEPSPSTTYVLVPSVVKGQRYDIVVRWIMGRTDLELGLAGPGNPGGGIGNHPNGGQGRVYAAVDGNWVVDTGNRTTLQRAMNPSDGKTYTQTIAERFWDGSYTTVGLSTSVVMEKTATRMGRTKDEMLVDGSSGFTLHSEWGEPSSGAGLPFTASLPPLNSLNFRVP